MESHLHKQDKKKKKTKIKNSDNKNQHKQYEGKANIYMHPQTSSEKYSIFELDYMF